MQSLEGGECGAMLGGREPSSVGAWVQRSSWDRCTAHSGRPAEGFDLSCGFCQVRAGAGARKVAEVGRPGPRVEGAGQVFLGAARAI